MNTNTTIAREEIKKLIMTIGVNNILCAHHNEIVERTGVSYGDIQNAHSYFLYSPSQASFRAKYF